MRPHQKLDLWRRAIDFVVRLYKVTDRFPKEEKSGLTSQVRRAAVLVAANIAEGAALTSLKEFMQFLSHSQGSASEVDTELLIASRLGYLSEKDYQELARDVDDIGRMITGSHRVLNADQRSSEFTIHDLRLTNLCVE